MASIAAFRFGAKLYQALATGWKSLLGFEFALGEPLVSVSL
jgi:hypothetical protein